MIAQTLRGAIGAIVRGSTRVADALDEQNRAANQLNADATGAFTRGAEAVSAQSADGTLLARRGARPLARVRGHRPDHPLHR